MDEAKQIAALADEYEKLMHALQTGVAAEMNYDTAPTQPKHLRVGINSTLCEQAALVKLLLEKGVFTEIEYYTALRDSVLAEVLSYEKRLKERYGIDIKLH